MVNYQLKNNEVILFEGNVFLENKKGNFKLLLTSERLLFEKEKGLFKKQFKVVDEILIKDIKIYKDNVQIKNNKSSVRIQTINKNVHFECDNNADAKLIVNNIINIKTGTNKIERGKNKLKKVAKMVNDSKEIFAIIGVIGSGIIKFLKSKK